MRNVPFFGIENAPVRLPLREGSGAAGRERGPHNGCSAAKGDSAGLRLAAGWRFCLSDLDFTSMGLIVDQEPSLFSVLKIVRLTR